MSSTLARTLAAAIRAERARMGLSQGELAERLDVSQSTVSAMELGERRVYADELVEICSTFGVSLSELLSRAERADRRALGL